MKETKLKEFLEIPYDKLEEMNLQAGKDSVSLDAKALEKKYTEYLKKEKRIKKKNFIKSAKRN